MSLATATPTNDDYATLSTPDTVRLQRLLPGPVERVWSCLTDGELRRQWLAAGDMELQLGAPFELVWHNDELTDPPGSRPEGFGAEHRMQCCITELDPPRRIAFSWTGSGDVCIELAPRGDQVLLTLTHLRLPDRRTMLMVGAGWHMHLAILLARLSGQVTEPFWDGWLRLRAEYDRRLPG